MDTGEIVRSYEQAKNPEQQIKILSDLTLRPVKDIQRILTDGGVYKHSPYYWTAAQEQELLRLKAKGWSYGEIATRLNRTKNSTRAKYVKLTKTK